MEQRFVAQQQVQHDPGRRGTQHDGAQHRRVHIAHDFFEREQHRGNRSVERGSERSRRAYRHQRLTLLGPSPRFRPSTDAIPAPTCTEGPSRPSAMPLARRCRAAAELAEHRANADKAIAHEQRGFGLRDAAAARVGKKRDSR